MPEGSKERGVGLSGSLENVANVEKLIFEKLNARRVTSLAPSPAEVCSSFAPRLLTAVNMRQARASFLESRLGDEANRAFGVRAPRACFGVQQASSHPILNRVPVKMRFLSPNESLAASPELPFRIPPPPPPIFHNFSFFSFQIPPNFFLRFLSSVRSACGCQRFLFLVLRKSALRRCSAYKKFLKTDVRDDKRNVPPFGVCFLRRSSRSRTRRPRRRGWTPTARQTTTLTPTRRRSLWRAGSWRTRTAAGSSAREAAGSGTSRCVRARGGIVPSAASWACGTWFVFEARETPAIGVSQQQYRASCLGVTVRSVFCLGCSLPRWLSSADSRPPRSLRPRRGRPFVSPPENMAQQSSSGAQVRVATERSLGKDALGKDSGERIVYVKGNKAQRDAALDMIRSNPKVGGRGGSRQ